MKRILFLLLIGSVFFFANRANAEMLKESMQEVPRISAELAYGKYQAGTTILVDAMNPDVYVKKHVLGAANVPYNREVLRMPFPEKNSADDQSHRVLLLRD